jgi:ABC-2 type transport system permease protein
MTTAVFRQPRATGELHRTLSLTWTLALTDWKLRFYGSVLGYVWMLARPFAFFGVIYVVFTQIVDLGGEVKNYGVYILFAMVLFQFFAEVTGNCVNCLVTRENLLRKMHFPRIVIPLSVVVTGLLNLAATLAAVLIFAVGSGIYPGWSWLELPVLVLLLAALATGVGMVLSVLFVRYRDVQPIWDVVSQILFYASPVLYVTTQVPESFQRPYAANPIATILTEMRGAFIDPGAPHVTDALGGPARLAIPLGIILALLGLGLWLFNREAPRIAEHL